MPTTTDMPLDVKLMALATQLLLGVFALLALGALGTWAVRHPAWTVKGISVHGDVAHQNAVGLRAQLATQMRARLSSSFLTVDLDQVRQMFEQVPWVRRAQVRRVYPGSLRVELQEHDAVAYWGPDTGSALVNSQGEVFEANVGDVEQDGLPRLLGPAGSSPEVLQMFGLLQPVFKPLGLEVETLAADLQSFVPGRRVDDNGHILMRYKGGARGMLWCSQVATGLENNLRLRVYGTKAGLEWAQEDPNYLWFTPFGQPISLKVGFGAEPSLGGAFSVCSLLSPWLVRNTSG